MENISDKVAWFIDIIVPKNIVEFIYTFVV